MRTLLACYGRLLQAAPVSFVCFDRDLNIVYPTGGANIPIDALLDIARRVMSTATAEANIALEGLKLTATCTPLLSGDNVIGALFTIENPAHSVEGRELVMLADAPIAVFDAKHTIVLANIAWQTLVPGNDIPPATAALLDRARGGEVVDLVDVELGGAKLDGVAGPLVSSLGIAEGTLVACRPRTRDELEIAERARDRVALAEAELASRQKDQFIATVSHELRAPLATMLLWEKVLRDETLDDATRKRALDAIRESATAQSHLVGDLLDVSRAINGKLHVERKPVAIDEVLAASVEAAVPQAAARKVDLRSELFTSHQRVLGDANRLRQVFENLLTNAIRSTDAGGSITVRSSMRDGVIVIAVEDTGRGISPELLQHLFEPFRQGQEPHAEGGLGLGLAVAKQLVTLHGGSLSAQSPGIGRGATFTVGLPIASRAVASPVTPARQLLGGVHVLVVDDDPRVLEALQLLLERAGAVVATAGSAAAGYGAAERASFDVVLSDLAMPGGDGCSMMKKIRSHETNVRVPAIAMTAHVAEGNRRDALSAGFDRYLTKPLDVDLLISTIASLVPAP